jgi:hypothetical protein
MINLTEDHWDLLRWLSESEYSQYGECYGRALNEVIGAGLVQIHPAREHQEGFIAQGDGPMYRAVSLTEKGRKLLEENT